MWEGVRSSRSLKLKLKLMRMRDDGALLLTTTRKAQLPSTTTMLLVAVFGRRTLHLPDYTVKSASDSHMR